MDLPVGVRSFENNSIDNSSSIDCIDSPDRAMQIARLYDCRRYRMVYGIEVAKVGRRFNLHPPVRVRSFEMIVYITADQ